MLNEGQLEKGRRAADRLWGALVETKERFPSVLKGIRGTGMMLGLVMNLEAEAVKSMQSRLLEGGFLVDVTQKTIIRLLPPLTLTEAEIDRFIEALSKQLQFEKESR